MIVPPAKKLEDLIHLAELCVDLLQQNEEHYAEVNSHHARHTHTPLLPFSLPFFFVCTFIIIFRFIFCPFIFL